jgi:hypothetical protein
MSAQLGTHVPAFPDLCTNWRKQRLQIALLILINNFADHIFATSTTIL